MAIQDLAMSTFLLSLLFLLAAPAPQTTAPNPADLCTIQGVVIRAGTGEPLHKASVEAVPAGSRTGNDQSQGGSAETDAMGRFEIKGINPGRYFLSAQRNGYVRQQYGQRTPGGSGAMLSLSPGEKISYIRFQMIPAAVIIGHVYDEDGEPVVYAQVMAMHFTYTNGERRLVGNTGGQTNDLGEFRLFGLSPGQYIVQATYRPSQLRNAGGKEGYLPTFYPGVPDAGRAAPVTVNGGDEFSGVDISLQSSRTLTVKGHIINAGCGTALQGAMVMLQNASPNSGQMNSGNSASNDQGAFELRNVLPGSYYLTAVLPSEGKQCVGRQPLEVSDADLDGVMLAVSPGVEIKGHLRLEGQSDSNPGALSISLSSKSNTPFFGVSGESVKADGSFLLKNAFDGEYEVYVNNLPGNSFVKSARLDGVDVLTAGLTVDTKQTPGSLEVVVSSNGASVDGAITKDQQPFPGATITLVPDPPHRGERRLFKSTTTDQTGHFVLQGLSPGDYKVFAWEKIDPGAYTSTEFLQPYENLGESVHVTEGSTNSVQVDLIPAKESSP
jgi:protocatechuate 3,4-dioxygenase beta subunit